MYVVYGIVGTSNDSCQHHLIKDSDEEERIGRGARATKVGDAFASSFLPLFSLSLSSDEAGRTEKQIY